LPTVVCGALAPFFCPQNDEHPFRRFPLCYPLCYIEALTEPQVHVRMQLQVADHWYETLGISADLTLIRETHVSPDLRCNIWHLRGRDRDLLIDSGLGVVSLRNAIGALSERGVLAVASHTHFDHIGCHHEFEHRLCHPAEARVLTLPSGANTVWSEYRPTMREVEVISALPFSGFSFAQYAIIPAPPSQLIDEGDELDLGNRLLRVFHMPGHSPGSICLYEEQTATLFTGDTLYDGELLDDREYFPLRPLRQFWPSAHDSTH
jgi:glyoxylase-like metal-dependent hydrolase (beta-lactamase superfamily II)